MASAEPSGSTGPTGPGTVPGPARPVSPEQLVARAAALAGAGGRRVLGIAGAPGSGKSTLAAWLVARLAERSVAAALVPMDGFHLADAELRRLDRMRRKGAPDTFDGAGYVALLRRLRAAGPGETGEAHETVYAPAFERTVEQPVAGSIPVSPEVALVVTEGNYLLLDEPPWSRVLGLLDEAWWIEADPVARVERLVERHVRFGKEPERARRFVAESDEANARRVADGALRADVVVAGGAYPVPVVGHARIPRAAADSRSPSRCECHDDGQGGPARSG